MIQRNYPILRLLPFKMMVDFLLKFGIDKSELRYLPQQFLLPRAKKVLVNETVLRLKIRFLEGANYLVAGSDQWDWLKMTGLKERTWQPYSNTTMLAFRHDPIKSKIEWAFYTHVGGDTVYESLGCLTDYADEIDVTIEHTHNLRRVTITANNVTYSKERYCLQPKAEKLYEVSGTLGGTASDMPMIQVEKIYL